MEGLRQLSECVYILPVGVGSENNPDRPKKPEAAVAYVNLSGKTCTVSRLNATGTEDHVLQSIVDAPRILMESADRLAELCVEVLCSRLQLFDGFRAVGLNNGLFIVVIPERLNANDLRDFLRVLCQRFRDPQVGLGRVYLHITRNEGQLLPNE